MNIIRRKEPEIVDTRGAINKILDGIDIKSVLLITSKAGTIRANHYHKKDTHYSYILSGSVEWSEKRVEGGEVEMQILYAGDMVYTPPMMIHGVRFLDDTTFLVFATESRDQKDYEEDTVRVELIK